MSTKHEGFVGRLVAAFESDRSPSRRAVPQRRVLLLLTLVMGLCGGSAGGSPPLRLCETNPHYLEWKGKALILVSSGEHYGAVINQAFDYRRYFDELASHGLNHTRAFVSGYRETPASFGITKNTLSPATGQFICPWPRSQEPGAWDGGAKFDLAKWDDEYFTRLKDFTREAERRDILIEFVLGCPMYKEDIWRVSPLHPDNNVNDLSGCPRDELLTLKHPEYLGLQLALVEKTVRELSEFGNFYFEICNEPYARDVPMAWQIAMIDRVTLAQEQLPNRHLISLNVANKTLKVEEPHPAVSILNFHYCVPPTAVGDNYELNRVIGENETGFRGRADFIYRTEAWNFLMAGGGLFNNLDYSFTADHPDGSFDAYESPGGGSHELRRQLGILKEFIESFRFSELRPSDQVIEAKPKGISVRVLAKPGREYAVYLHTPIPWKPNPELPRERAAKSAMIGLQLPAGAYAAEWISPTSGGVLQREAFDHSGGVKRLKSPEFAIDMALSVLQQSSAELATE